MEKIKMYELEWIGQTDRSTVEVTEILREVVKTCVGFNACGYDAWSVTSNQGGEIFVKIVTIRKDSATDMIEWMKSKAAISLEMSEIEVSPLLFEN